MEIKNLSNNKDKIKGFRNKKIGVSFDTTNKENGGIRYEKNN